MYPLQGEIFTVIIRKFSANYKLHFFQKSDSLNIIVICYLLFHLIHSRASFSSWSRHVAMVRRKRGKCNEFLYLKKYSSAVRNIFCDITVWHFFVTYSDLSWYFTDWYCFTKEFVIRFPSEKVGNLGGLVVIEDESCRQAKRFNPLTRCVWVTTPVKYNNKTFGIITWAATCFRQSQPCDDNYCTTSENIAVGCTPRGPVPPHPRRDGMGPVPPNGPPHRPARVRAPRRSAPRQHSS